MPRGLLAGLALLALLSVAGPAAAEQDWAYEMAGELMSPWCPGRTLSDCPSGEAGTLRSWIHLQKAAGRSRAEVEDELVERYGESILAAPRAEGFGIAAYTIPVVIFLAGGVLVYAILRRLTRGGGEAASVPAGPAAVDPELERQLDEELAR